MKPVIEKLLSAKNPLVFTGAGISKDSGIQTFRALDGLWRNFDPEKLATLDGFLSDPKLVWNWYLERIGRIKTSGPNMAHRFVASLDRFNPQTCVITQNVDDLHRKAGSRNVIELHGNIFKVKCLSCAIRLETDEVDFGALPPYCGCGSMLRPDVVWFGEMLPQDAIRRSYELAEKADLIIVIGTSCLVYPAAQIPFIVKKSGGIVMEFNPEETPLSPFADVRISRPTQEFYKELADAVA